MNFINYYKKIITIAFLFGFVFLNISLVRAGVVDDIVNLFTNNINKKDETQKYSLSYSDLLKPFSINLAQGEEMEEEINIKEDGTMRVQSGTLRISTEKEKIIDDTISLYEVKSGDTLDTVAKLFNVSKNTIIWANNLKSNKIIPGQSLLIFPITGINYTAKSSISIYDIAKKYKADAEEIAMYNGISVDAKIIKGESIFIPDAEAEIVAETTKKTTNTKQPKYKNNAIAGYFMKPVSGCILTQGLHGPYTTAVDWGCPVGTATVAAADGVVIRSILSGYNGGYGGVIIISHPNGTQSIYAHMSAISVSVGQKVKQGQVIGNTGNTGRSTGPHLHFETRGTRNPFS